MKIKELKFKKSVQKLFFEYLCKTVRQSHSMTKEVNNKLTKTLSIRLSEVQYVEFLEYCYESRIAASTILRHIIDKLIDKNNNSK